jgi:hypothetical protein
MANLSYPINSYPDNGGYAVQRSIYKAFTPSLDVSYIHFKTNVPLSGYIMTMIEAVGYNYGMSLPVRCSWAFYTYGTSIPFTNVVNGYGGMQANGIYASADGYACIRGHTPSASGGSYFNGFVLNAYQTAGNGRGFPVQVLAASYGNNSGSAF